MTGRMDIAAIQARLAAVEEDNLQLRTALAAAEARAAASGHELLLRDAMYLREDLLECRHAAVPGRVSVIIPAYNAERHLERAVRSVWNQTLASNRIEILIVDDGSRDETRSLAERLAARSPVTTRILAHDGGRNRGVAPTRQLAAREATGEFVALLDADDVYLPNRLKRTVDLLMSDPTLAAVCSLGRNVDDRGDTVKGHNGTTQAGAWRTLDDRLSPPFTFDQLWRVDPIANSSLTIRRDVLEEVGGFAKVMAHQAEDWLLVLKISLVSAIPCLDEELILYTHHPGAYTHAYHASGWTEGSRLEVFYHIAWWMMRSPTLTESGARFFRREYPKLVAEHQRLLPLLREYYATGGRPAAGPAALGEHLQRLTAELETLRRVVTAKLHENKRLRAIASAKSDALLASALPR